MYGEIIKRIRKTIKDKVVYDSIEMSFDIEDEHSSELVDKVLMPAQVAPACHQYTLHFMKLL